MLYGTPPFPVNVQKSPGEQAFSEVRQALKAETVDTPTLFMVESKKLGLGIVEAFELLCTYRRRGLEFNQAQILRQELQHQVMAFALMRVLNDEDIKGAAVRTQEKLSEAAQGNPPMTRAGLLVREMEALIEQNEQTEEIIKQALVIQPLFRVMSQKPEVLDKLDEHYPQIALTVPQLVAGINESLVQLMQMQTGGYRPPQAPSAPSA